MGAGTSFSVYFLYIYRYIHLLTSATHNMSLTALLIDDEPFALNDLENQLLETQLVGLIKSCHTVAEAVEFVGQHGPVAFVFCDIEMPGVDGFDAIALLENECERFVYVTGHGEHLRQANDLDMDGFLVKPVTQAMLLKQLKKLIKKRQLAAQHDPPQIEKVFVRDGSKRQSVALALTDITHVCGARDYIEIHTGAQMHMAHQTLKGFMKAYEASGRFIRINRSVIVAKEAISGVAEDMVKLTGGESYVIGRKNSEAFQAFYGAHLLHRGKEEHG